MRNAKDLSTGWTGPAPTTGYILELDPVQGGSIGLKVKNAAKWTAGGTSYLNALKQGAGSGGVKTVTGGTKQSPLSVRLPTDGNGKYVDFYLGFELKKSKKIDFDSSGPFSTGDSGAAIYFAAADSFVDGDHAYFLVKGSSLTGSTVKPVPFNIHLVSHDEIDGQDMVTPIIFDPDIRWPEGSGPP